MPSPAHAGSIGHALWSQITYYYVAATIFECVPVQLSRKMINSKGLAAASSALRSGRDPWLCKSSSRAAPCHVAQL